MGQKLRDSVNRKCNQPGTTTNCASTTEYNFQLTVEEYVQTMDKLTTDMRFTVFNICYKRILVIWIATAFTILLCLLFSGFQVNGGRNFFFSSAFGKGDSNCTHSDLAAGRRALRVRSRMARDECGRHLHLHVGEAEAEQAAGKVHVVHQLKPHEAQDSPRPRRQGAVVVP